MIPIEVTPWRFDSARNQLLKHLPKDADICISLDFDERFCDGWRNAVESVWSDDTTKLTYEYSEHLSGNYNQINTIITSRIHSRNDYKWIYPVHETLQYTQGRGERIVFCPELKITHTPDKSKSRSSYLKLMECSVAENSENLVFRHNLGRLYYQNNQLDACINSMKWVLEHPDVTDLLIVASKRYVYRSCADKGQYGFAQAKLLELIQEYPNCSSAYMELCTLAYKNNDFKKIIQIADEVTSIDFSFKSIYNEFANTPSLLYDIISIAYFNESRYSKALEFAQKALVLDAGNERLKKNIVKIKEFI